MKNVKQIILYSLLAIFGTTFFASCSTSNDVVNNSLIQKRKYRSGFYVKKKADKQNTEVSNDRTEVVLENMALVPEVVVQHSNAELKVIEKVADKRTEPEARAPHNSDRPQQDVRQTTVDFTTGVATVSLVQRRAKDENLNKAIALSVLSVIGIVIGISLFKSTCLAISLSCFSRFLFGLLLIASGIVALVFAVIKFVQYLKKREHEI